MGLLEEARQLIKNHLRENPQLSILGLSLSAGLPASTGRSIITGEVSRTTSDKILALLTTFMPYAEAIKLVQKHEPNSFLAGPYTDKPQDTAAMKSDDTRRAGFEWEYPDPFLIAWAGLSDGASLDLVTKQYGEQGRKRISLLINAGILREVNGRIKECADHNFYVDPMDSVKKVRIHANTWQLPEQESQDFLYHATQVLTHAGLAEVREILKRSLNELLAVEAKHRGNDIAFVFSMLGSVLKEAGK